MKSKYWIIFIFLLFLILSCVSTQKNSGPLIPFEEGNVWGYRNARGETILEPRFIIAGPFNAHGIAAVVDEKGWVYIDSRGRAVIRPYVFDNGPDDFREGLARVRMKGKFGFFNESGTVTIKPGYDFAGPFQNGRAPVCEGCREEREGEYSWFTGGRWGFIDITGKIAVPVVFDEVEPFQKGKARVRENGRWVFIDREGKSIP